MHCCARQTTPPDPLRTATAVRSSAVRRLSVMSLLSLSHRLSSSALHHAQVARSAVAAMACRSMTSAAAAAAQPAASAEDSAAAAAAALPPLRLGSASNRVNFAAPRVRAGQNVSKASTVSYPLDTAVGLVRACATAAFDETVELAIRLNLDPRKPNQSVRGAAALPHGTGKLVRVAVFAKGEKAQEALAAGADIVGEKELVDQVRETGRSVQQRPSGVSCRVRA